MKVKWTYHRPLHTIPEMYWGEDLSKLDRDYEGEVINFFKWAEQHHFINPTGNYEEVINQYKKSKNN